MSLRTRRLALLLAGILAAILALIAGSIAHAADPLARAVLFYSPTCPHCHVVMQEVLPPLQERFGTQLEIFNVDVTQPAGQALYRTAVTTFNITQDRLGVPMMVIGSTVLVGEVEIPGQLPGLIESGLAAGGIDWPAITGLEEQLATSGLTANTAQSPFQNDPVGNSMSLVLLLIMTVSVFVIAVNLRPPFDRPLPPWRLWAIPILSFVGIVVAVYLTSIEVRGAEAFCGPVGDCNAVQQSSYAKLFGIVPVGLLGVIGYSVLLMAWAVRQFGGGNAARWAGNTMLAIAFAGTLFSIYLTFLEPFVIGATCIWCLTSAALMTGILWLIAPHGAPPVQRGRGRGRGQARQRTAG